MGTASEIARSFNSDALRLSERADHLIKKMKAQAHRKEPLLRAHVNTFYQVVHTLKGTASMLSYGAPLVQALEEVEGRLATRSLEESAANPHDWLDLGEKAIDQVKSVLLAQTGSRTVQKAVPSALNPIVTDKGLLAEVQVAGKKRQLWFPVSCLVRVLASQEIRGRKIVSLNGVWVPVIGQSKMGLGIQTDLGQAVVTVDEIHSLMTWSEASGQGALSGPELLMPKATPRRDSSAA